MFAPDVLMQRQKQREERPEKQSVRQKKAREKLKGFGGEPQELVKPQCRGLLMQKADTRR